MYSKFDFFYPVILSLYLDIWTFCHEDEVLPQAESVNLVGLCVLMGLVECVCVSSVSRLLWDCESVCVMGLVECVNRCVSSASRLCL